MDIIVHSRTTLEANGKIYSCVVGRNGITTNKSEGDGATPVGRFALRSLRYRADRIEPPKTHLITREISPLDGWCDAPENTLYNRAVTLPFDASHEILWRNDNLYNLMVDLGYNDNPALPGEGSAIFFHVMSLDATPTEGCVALCQEDLLEVLTFCGPNSHIEIKVPRS